MGQGGGQAPLPTLKSATGWRWLVGLRTKKYYRFIQKRLFSVDPKGL